MIGVGFIHSLHRVLQTCLDYFRKCDLKPDVPRELFGYPEVLDQEPCAAYYILYRHNSKSREQYLPIVIEKGDNEQLSRGGKGLKRSLA
jgi:hypothetical protein